MFLFNEKCARYNESGKYEFVYEVYDEIFWIFMQTCICQKQWKEHIRAEKKIYRL